MSVKEAVTFCPEVPLVRDAGISPTGVPHCVVCMEAMRQTRVGPTFRIVWRSVVTLGTVQVRVTRLPLRTARRSDGGLGKYSEGGCGGFIVAHPMNIDGAANTSSFVAGNRMEKKTDYQKRRTQFGHTSAHKFPHGLMKDLAMPVHVFALALRRHQRKMPISARPEKAIAIHLPA